MKYKTCDVCNSNLTVNTFRGGRDTCVFCEHKKEKIEEEKKKEELEIRLV